jgi:hypothetical protein
MCEALSSNPSPTNLYLYICIYVTMKQCIDGILMTIGKITMTLLVETWKICDFELIFTLSLHCLSLRLENLGDSRYFMSFRISYLI